MYLFDDLRVVGIKCTSKQFQVLVLLSEILLAISTQVSNYLLDLKQATKDISVIALPWLPQICIPSKD